MVGHTIGHYRVLEKLGQGGMGEVWKAEDLNLERLVALKFVTQAAFGDDEVKARLMSEARAAAALDHPGICPVYGIHDIDGESFIALAFIDGPSLAEMLREQPLPFDEALRIAIECAEALHEAHEKGVLHCDIKPQNIMLTSKGQVKVMDFGLAALSGRKRLAKPGMTMGTPAYMSPEQIEGREVDRRCDVWSLGCSLYQMLTRRTPFEADYIQAIAYGVVNEEPEPATALRHDLPSEIDCILGKALAKNPDQRYPTLANFAADLRRLRGGESGTSKAASPRPAGRVLTLGWWTFHQIAAVVSLVILAAALWEVGDLAPGVVTRSAFIAGLASASITGTLRIHLLFTSRYNRAAMFGEMSRVLPWMRGAEWGFCLTLAVAALAIALERRLVAAVLMAAAVGYAAVSFFVEPATRAAVFKDE